MKRWHGLAPLALVPLGLLLQACLPPVSLTTQKVPEAYSPTTLLAAVGNTPGEHAQWVLDEHQLRWAYQQDPAAAIRTLDWQRDRQPEPGALGAVAELALLEARKLEEVSRASSGAAGRFERARAVAEARAWYLLAAERSFELLSLLPRSSSLIGAGTEPGLDIYNRAVAGFLRHLPGVDRSLADEYQEPVLEKTVVVRIGGGDGTWPAQRFDLFLPAGDFEVRGLEHHYLEPGFGAPVIAYRRNLHVEPKDYFLPPEGVACAATAVLLFGPEPAELDPAPRGVSLRFYDPRRVKGVTVGERWMRLAADLTAPYAYLIQRADLGPLGRRGLRHAGETWDHLGVFLLEPYDPDKVPVLMIHGLLSTPLAWAEISNEVMGRPELRERYQVWHYMYPTGLPFLYSAMLLRESLGELREVFDPLGDDPGPREMVVVAHSMGGLLARTLVTESGTALWDAVFSQPLESLQVQERDRELLRAIFFLEPLPQVRRVIFLATPHRGSDATLSLAGSLGASLVRIPPFIKGFFRRVARGNEDAVHDSFRGLFEKGGPSSIRTLSPDDPLLQALADLPLEGVPYHSIVGDRGLGGGWESSDGWVAYASSHLGGAQSELIVPSGHKVYEDPGAIEEVVRILELHLEELGPGARPWLVAGSSR